MSQRIIIIGGVAGGMTTAAKAKRSNPELDITVYERSGYISYSACGMPYVISGEVPTIARLIARTPTAMAEQGIVVKTQHEVTAIDPEGQTVSVRALVSDHSFRERYDKLVIATGATAKRPAVPGSALAGVHTLRRIEDLLHLRAQLDAGARRAVIVGGGYIGVEMAEGLRKAGLSVTLIERGAQLLKSFAPQLAERLQRRLEQHGVTITLGAKVTAFEGDGRVRAVVLEDEVLEADIVLFAGGAEPASALGREIGLDCLDNGAIVVDEQLKTSCPNIYAVGDVTAVWHRVSRQHLWLPLGDTANRQGRVLGAHLAGQAARFTGVLGTLITKAFELGVAKTGLSLAEAEAAGFDAKMVSIEDTDRAGYYPGADKLVIYVVFETDSQRLLGAQLIGQTDAVKRVDVFATLLHYGATLNDIAALDLAYAPPFSGALDSVIVAANVALAAK
jgi:NADPH-dependent 2,4-dienoyl-CoA reductase/sulfur reductase-like enzyme